MWCDLGFFNCTRIPSVPDVPQLSSASLDSAESCNRNTSLADLLHAECYLRNQGQKGFANSTFSFDNAMVWGFFSLLLHLNSY